MQVGHRQSKPLANCAKKVRVEQSYFKGYTQQSQMGDKSTMSL